ncbi:MAG: DUF4332 domain-containing protein [Candidatus Thorarchaeota archaeon]|jgi:hypothetical protein
MNEVVNVATINCTGRSKDEDDHLIDPCIIFNINPLNTMDEISEGIFNCRIDTLSNDLVIRIKTEYHEATLNLDEPSYRVTVRDNSDQSITILEETYDPEIVRDTYNHYDEFIDRYLEYVIPIEDLSDNTIISLDFEMEGIIEQWEWVEGNQRGTQLETITESRTITVNLDIGDIQEIVLSPTCINLEGVSNTGHWRKDYWFEIGIKNNTSKIVKLDVSIEEDFAHLGPLSCIPWGQCNPSQIDPGKTQYYRSQAFNKDWNTHIKWIDTSSSPNINKEGLWQWWETYDCGCKINEDMLVQDFNYLFSANVTKIGDEDVSELFQKTLKIPVNVSQDKQTYALTAHDYLGWLCFWKNSMFVAGLILGPALALLGLKWATVKAAISGILAWASIYSAWQVHLITCSIEDILGSSLKVGLLKDKCPIPFDNKFRELKEPSFEEDFTEIEMPYDLKEITIRQRRIVSLSDTLDITYNRFLSAKKMNKKREANRQLEYAQELESEIRSETRQLSRLISSAKKEMSDIDQDEARQALSELQKSDVMSDAVEELRNANISEDAINEFRNVIQQIKPEDILIDVTNPFDKLKKKTLEIQFEASEKIVKFKDIDSLSKEDLGLELLREGLVEPARYSEYRKKKANATRYLITEIDEIHHRYRELLLKAGIGTSEEFTQMCSTERKLTEVSARTGISRKQLRLWVRILKLMKLRGLGEDDAKALLIAGVEHPRDLRNQKSKTLQKRMRKLKSEKKMKIKIPTESRISQWIEASRKLPEEKKRHRKRRKPER